MKQTIIVRLEQSPDYPANFDIADISDNIGSLEECDSSVGKLEIGSWIRRNELGVKKLQSKNKHIKFVLPNSD